MSLWKNNLSAEEINENYFSDTLIENLGIKITKITDYSIEATMPVTNKIKQPFGFVHGGANCSLAETLANVAGNLVLDNPNNYVLGLALNSNNVKAVRDGIIKGVVGASHIGKKTHIWEVQTFDQQNNLTSTTTVTLAVIEKE